MLPTLQHEHRHYCEDELNRQLEVATAALQKVAESSATIATLSLTETPGLVLDMRETLRYVRDTSACVRRTSRRTLRAAESTFKIGYLVGSLVLLLLLHKCYTRFVAQREWPPPTHSPQPPPPPPPPPIHRALRAQAKRPASATTTQQLAAAASLERMKGLTKKRTVFPAQRLVVAAPPTVAAASPSPRLAARTASPLVTKGLTASPGRLGASLRRS